MSSASSDRQTALERLAKALYYGNDVIWKPSVVIPWEQARDQREWRQLAMVAMDNFSVEQAAPERNWEVEGEKYIGGQLRTFLDEHQVLLADARAAIREALETYVQHQRTCITQTLHPSDIGKPCNCGLDDFLTLSAVVAAVKEEKT